ncbi:MAG: ABC transporter substrate-binding protein, partial [Bacillota bacterium]|nr:ABC transporter substrate-binding protein [Bacillota bacterium]
MRVTLRNHSVLITMLLVVTMLVGCGAQPAPAPKKAEAVDTRGILIYAERDDPVWLNPVLEKAGQDTRNNQLMFDSLFMVDVKGNVIPSIGASHTVSPDGREITVKLVTNAKWHDGTPVTADDVVFTFMAHLHPKVPSRYKGDLWALVGYDKIVDPKNPAPFSDFKPVETIDKYTVKFKLSQPYAPFLTVSLVNTMIVPKHLLEKDLEKMPESKFNQSPIGCGPFKFKSWKKDDSVVYEAFDDYYLGKPKLKGIIYRIIPDVTVQSLEMQKGSVHGMGV